MERRVYESGTLTRVAALAVAALACACGEPDGQPAPAARPDAAQAEAAIAAAEALLADNRPSDAVMVAERLAGQVPDRMDVHELHARALLTLGGHPDLPPGDRAAVLARAADAYDRAAALDALNPALRHAAGVVSDSAGRAAAAADHYEAAHRADPSNAQYALYLGLARARAGRNDEARSLLELAERAMPESPDPKAALADLAARSGDRALARRKIAEARTLAPSSAELRLADARMRRLDGDPRGALDLLLALDAPERRDAGTAEEIAASFDALGDHRAAAQALEESCAAAPNDWRRSLRAASAWMRAGDPVRATIAADAAAAAGAPPEEARRALSGASGPRPGEEASP
jgi:predicted Zn-dependent protease